MKWYYWAGIIIVVLLAGYLMYRNYYGLNNSKVTGGSIRMAGDKFSDRYDGNVY